MGELVTQTELRTLIVYDPVGGVFTSLINRWQAKTGAPLGTRRPDGYVTMGIWGRSYLAHRLAWFYVHGEWPMQIDHIDGNPSNNALANLRPANFSTNGANAKCRRDNRSGFKGVTFIEGKGWRARVQDGGKRRYLGYFPTAEMAHAAYMQGAAKAFGEFARAA